MPIFWLYSAVFAPLSKSRFVRFLFCGRLFSMSSLLFKNAMVVGLSGILERSVFVKDGLIQEGEGPADRVVEARGLILFPGVIDAHVHLRDPGFPDKEDFLTGTRAAAAGGVTTVLDMPNTVPAVTTCAILEEKRRMAAKKSVVNFDLYMGAIIDPSTGRTNVEEFLKSDAVALKVYMGHSTGGLLVDQEAALREIFSRVAEAGRLVCVHAEDEALLEANRLKYAGESDPLVHGKIRSPEVALRATERALELARELGTRLHLCHVSIAGEVELLQRFKTDRISAEVTPHHLFLDEGDVALKGNLLKVNPPIRTAKDREALWHALEEGVIDMVATDHAPHTLEEKSRGYEQVPSGMPGLETLLPLLAGGAPEFGISPSMEPLARWLCENPARVFGFSKKGRIQAGYDADLVLLPSKGSLFVVERGGRGARETKAGWSPFEGRALAHWPLMTVVGGNIVFEA